MIKISLEEYQSMKETIKTLQNPELISQILESEENIKNGNLEKLEI